MTTLIIETSIMERILHKLLLLDYIKDQYALEFQNSCIKIVVGFLLLTMGNIAFEKYAVIYKYVAIIDPVIWGLMFIAIGATHLYCLFYRKIKLRKNILWVAGVTWTTFGSSIIIADPNVFVGYIYMIIAITCFRCYICIQIFNRFNIDLTNEPNT